MVYFDCRGRSPQYAIILCDIYSIGGLQTAIFFLSSKISIRDAHNRASIKHHDTYYYKRQSLLKADGIESECTCCNLVDSF